MRPVRHFFQTGKMGFNESLKFSIIIKCLVKGKIIITDKNEGPIAK